MNHIKIGDTVVDYELIFTNRKKTIGISIDRNKKLKVRAPRGLSESDVRASLYRKSKWILINLERMDNNLQDELLRKFVSGEKFLLKGRSYGLEVLESENDVSPSLIFNNAKFVATVPKNISRSEYREHIRPLFIDYYSQKAEQVINERIDVYLSHFAETPSAVKVNEFKSKWGSCSGTNQLKFNWKIVMADLSIIDYLVVHELCHMIHKNHSRDYWDSVEAILPDHKERRKWLRLNGARLNI